MDDSPAAATAVEDAPEPSGFVGAFDELLKSPHRLLTRARAMGPRPSAGRLALGSLAALAAYGAAAGIFQGGDTIALAAFKAPLIVVFTLALCLPSLYIFAALAGAEISRRLFVLLIAGFAGMVALLLVGLLPIAWLFSVSSRSLPFVVWLHLLAWLTAVCFGVRFLLRGLDGRGAIALRMWLVLFLIVSFQAATFLRPVLWRGRGEGLFAGGKMSFFEQLGNVYRVRTVPAVKPAADTRPAARDSAGR